jgi:hypothetical protein
MGTIPATHNPLPEAPRNASHEYRCIFIHVPKAAGTSIKRVFGMLDRGHLPWSYYALCHPELWEAYTSFTVVRNPWDRLVSAYHFARMRNSYWHNPHYLPDDYELLSQKSFEECVTILREERERLKNLVWHTQMRWVASPKSLGGKVMVDRVLRFENIDHDFRELCRELGVSERELPRINTSDRAGHYQQYYNERTRKIVEEIYAEDIEAFGYSF